MALFQSFKAKRLTLALLTAFAMQGGHAITLQPIEVLSSPDELLYAEIRFTGADTSKNMNVSVASAEDLASLGINEPISAEHLNFYSRSNNYGDGVITITSNKPLTEKELNVVIKINQGNATRLQHIRTPLKATLTKEQIANNERNLIPTVITEKDLALHLPESSQITTNTVKPAVTTKAAQPVISATAASSNPVTAQATENKPTTPNPAAHSKPTTAQAQPLTKSSNQTTTAQAQPTANTADHKPTQQDIQKKDNNAYRSEFLVIQRTLTLPNGQKLIRNDLDHQPNPQAQTQTQPDTNAKSVAENNQPVQHTVQKNESLWSIAQSISSQTSQPIHEVMKQIKQNNPNAFVNGKDSLLRQGTVLNVIVAPNSTETNHTEAASKKPTTKPHATQPQPKPKQSTNKTTTASTASKPHAHQQQARLSLVAESKQNSAYGSAKAGSGNNKTSANLNSKVMQAREKAVSTQKDVSNLTNTLKSKDQKLQVLNARLAQLEQQLKNQPTKKTQ